MRMSRQLGLVGRSSVMAYTYTGTAVFSGDPKGDWVLTLKDSGTLVFKNLPTNIDVFMISGGANGGPKSQANYGGAEGYHYKGGYGGAGGETKTQRNFKPTRTNTITIGGAGQDTVAFGLTAVANTGQTGTRSGGDGIVTSGRAGNGVNGVYAFGESTFSHALGAGYRFGASGGGGSGGIPATSDFGSEGHGGTSGAGDGGTWGKDGKNADANSGSGGGGCGGYGANTVSPGNGGSGIVIIRNAR